MITTISNTYIIINIIIIIIAIIIIIIIIIIIYQQNYRSYRFIALRGILIISDSQFPMDNKSLSMLSTA